MSSAEIKAEILFYLEIDQRITFFEEMLKAIRKEYYSNQSFTGGMINDLTHSPYHRTYTVEQHALTLVDYTAALDTKIKKLRDRERHFNNYLKGLNIQELKTALLSECNDLSQMELDVYEEIQEIEQYIKFKYQKFSLHKKMEVKNEKEMENEREKISAELKVVATNIFSRLGSVFE